jgi:hypothetical protein
MARHIRDKIMLKQRAQTTKPKHENHKEPPAYMQAPPEPMQLPLDECMQTTSQIEQLLQLCSDRSNQSTSPVRLVDKIVQHLGTTPIRPVCTTGQADATWETARAQK